MPEPYAWISESLTHTRTGTHTVDIKMSSVITSAWNSWLLPTSGYNIISIYVPPFFFFKTTNVTLKTSLKLHLGYFEMVCIFKNCSPCWLFLVLIEDCSNKTVQVVSIWSCQVLWWPFWEYGPETSERVSVILQYIFSLTTGVGQTARTAHGNKLDNSVWLWHAGVLSR